MAENHTIQQADAEQAYINAKLNTTETWVRLPPNRVPARWKHMRDPVFRLVLALYGHPESGGHWEAHANAILLKEKWEPVSIDAFRSVYFHKALECILILYVDDFRIAGPAVNMKKAWETISRNIKIGAIEDSGKFLGCDHKLSEKIIPAGGDPWRKYDKHELKGECTKLKIIEYDMEEFLKSCVSKYTELTGCTNLTKAETPFIDEVKADKEYFALQYAIEDAKPKNSSVSEKSDEVGELKPIAARIIT